MQATALRARLPVIAGQREPSMTRFRLINKFLYAGVIVLCIISCWNARLLYMTEDGSNKPKPSGELAKIIQQRDVLFDTVQILKKKCSSGEHDHFPMDERKANMVQGNSACKPRLQTGLTKKDLEKSLVLGYKREDRDFLAIGIPTVKRETDNYLADTLTSILKNLTPDDQKEVTVVIFLADQDEESRYMIKNMLLDKFIAYLEAGFIQVIQAPTSFYPPMENLKQNFGDSEERVRWRAKQVVDYAFMFTYCQSLSEYYLQLEDDVITTPGFLKAIRDFINVNRVNNWVSLEFSSLGFIGKLYHSFDLGRLAQFVLFFYEDQPIDYLYKYFNALNAQQQTFLRAPSIFQHKGIQSSLRNKEQKVQDRFFETESREFTDSDNPPGKVYSNMVPFSMYLPQLSYSAEPGFFWAKSPLAGDVIVLVFDEPVHLSRIVVKTGSQNHPQDTLQDGKLDVSPALLSNGDGKSLPECDAYVAVGIFIMGNFDDTDVGSVLPDKIACIRISVLRNQVQWLAVREIAVWTRHG